MNVFNLLLVIGTVMLIHTVSAENATNETIHKTETNIVTDLEGNMYKVVKIGDQIWLGENLRSTKFQDGTEINTAFIPNDDESKLLQYGRLYDWHDVSDSRNICPVGWRVATDEDWKILEKYIGMSDEDLNKKGWRGDNDLAITLKEFQENSIFHDFDQSQVNRFDFSVKPGGIKWKYWYFVQGMYAEFWTSTSTTEKDAYNRTFAHSFWNWHKGEIYRSSLSKSYMFSVRCIKI